MEKSKDVIYLYNLNISTDRSKGRMWIAPGEEGDFFFMEFRQKSWRVGRHCCWLQPPPVWDKPPEERLATREYSLEALTCLVA